MEKELVADKIVLYKNVMPDPMGVIAQAEDLMKKFDRGWMKAVINEKEYNPDLRSCTILSLYPDPFERENNPEWVNGKTDINATMNKFLAPSMIDYFREFGFKTKEKEPWEILRYEETQKLVWHCDDGPAHPCQVSTVFYFNDDYEGGEIQFKDHMGGIPFKPPANSLIVFPSNLSYIHRVVPITKGVKYAAISFAK